MIFDEKTKGIAQAYLSMLGEKTEINESHYKVGERVKCKKSGMLGKVTKVDPKGEGKYYTVKQDSGREMTFAPDELTSVSDVKEASCNTKKEAIEIVMPKKSKVDDDEEDDEDEDEMEDDDEVKIKVKDDKSDKKAKMTEALKGNQHKLDKNNNGKLDAQDFKMLKGKKVKEDVEQVDELSKRTLGSYVKKAAHDAVIQRKIGADFENLGNKARKPGMKSSAQELEKQYTAKSRKRRAGINTAVDRLTKEDTEQMEEAAKWRQGYSASGHPAGFKHKSGEVGPVGGTFTHEPDGYGGETKQVPVNKYRNSADELAGRAGTKTSTTGKPLQKKNADRNLKQAILQSRGKHGPTSKLPEHVEMEEGAYKRMATDAEETKRLSPGSVTDKSGAVHTPMSRVKHIAQMAMKKKGEELKKQGMKEESELVWDWDAILEAPEDEINSLIDQLSEEDFDSFVGEFDTLEEGGNYWYQGSTNSKQPMDANGRETLDPRAQADRAFSDAHRQTTDVKDYPGKDKPVTNAKPQAPLRPGDKRNSEPKKTLSDIRNK
jgi:hypothetical protein